MFSLILPCLIGVCIGTITGLVPGIHVNTAGAILFALSSFLLGIFSSEFLAVVFVSMAIAHGLLEFIPSMLLGVPDEGTALTVLPGHRMVLEGRSKEAIRIIAIGGFGAIIITIILIPIFLLVLPSFHGLFKPYTPFVLLLGSIYLAYKLSSSNKLFIWSLLLFTFSGILGWTVMETPIPSGLSLMVLFSGLFGISTILFSLNDNSSIPYQNHVYDFNLDKNSFKSIFAGGISGAILGFLPGFGPAQGGIIAQSLSGTSENSDNTKSFLLAISGLNTADCLFSLIAIYLIGNPRSGIAVYISYIIPEFSIIHLLIFVSASLLAVGLALILTLIIGDRFSNFISGIDYKKLSYFVIFLMIVIMFIFAIVYEGPIFYLILMLITSTGLGLLPHYIGISKSHLMGVLIVPAIIIYFQMGL